MCVYTIMRGTYLIGTGRASTHVAILHKVHSWLYSTHCVYVLVVYVLFKFVCMYIRKYVDKYLCTYTYMQ